MKTTPLVQLVVTVLACLAVGCGGGSPLPGPAPGAEDPATLKVLVVENDGQTTGLDGHEFTIVQTGEAAISGPDGAVPFGPISPGSLTLRLASAYALQLEAQEDDEGEDHDPDDAEYADRAEVHVERVQTREQIEVRIHLCDAVMNCVRVSRQLGGECDVEVEMERTDENDDPDMAGELELECDLDRQTFEVEVENAESGRDLELVVIDIDGNEESQGLRTVDDSGEADWTMDTGVGDSLPFAVDDLDELQGCDVEVRDGVTGVALLTATVPGMPPPAGGDAEDRLRGCALLTAVEPGLEGYVEINSRDDGDCESFHMEAQELAAGRTVGFFVEDPDQAGSFLDLGTRTAHGSKGLAHLGLSTSTGAELPGGVEAVADLVGLRVEVRDADTMGVLLYGTIPELIAD